MLGNIDEPTDFDATAIVSRFGLSQPGTLMDSRGFLLGYQLGFLAGYRAAQEDAQHGVDNSYAAYQRDKALAGE